MRTPLVILSAMLIISNVQLTFETEATTTESPQSETGGKDDLADMAKSSFQAGFDLVLDKGINALGTKYPVVKTAGPIVKKLASKGAEVTGNSLTKMFKKKSEETTEEPQDISTATEAPIDETTTIKNDKDEQDVENEDAGEDSEDAKSSDEPNDDSKPKEKTKNHKKRTQVKKVKKDRQRKLRKETISDDLEDEDDEEVELVDVANVDVETPKGKFVKISKGVKLPVGSYCACIMP